MKATEVSLTRGVYLNEEKLLDLKNPDKFEDLKFSDGQTKEDLTEGGAADLENLRELIDQQLKEK